MVQFNQLEIIDGKLVIDAQINCQGYYDNVYIRAIYIAPYLDNKDIDHSDCVWYQVFADTPYEGTHTPKRIKFNLSPNMFAKKSRAYYVWVETAGVPSPDTPCYQLKDRMVGVCFDKNKIRSLGMDFLKGVGDTCQVDKDFIDYILKYEALNIALETGNYKDVVKYIDLFQESSSITVKKCGCGY